MEAIEKMDALALRREIRLAELLIPRDSHSEGTMIFLRGMSHLVIALMR